MFPVLHWLMLWGNGMGEAAARIAKEETIASLANIVVCVVVVVSAAEMCATEDPGELSVSLLYCFALAVLLNNFFFRLITSVLKPLNISLASQAQ